MPSFPQSGGIASLSGIPDIQIFASPDGSDGTRTGSISSPFKTAYAAARRIVELGGGTLNLSPYTTIGNPVAGMGLCFRGDFLDVPGWLGDVPMIINGSGANSAHNTPFQLPGAAFIYGSDNSPLTPFIWTTQTASPKYFSNLYNALSPEFFDSGVCSPMRFGWDYNRNNDGTPRELAVTNASRADGQTVFTVTLPAGFTILSGKRGTVGGVANTVTLTVQLPSNTTYSPWFIGSIVRVVTSDSDFPSVDATVTDQSDGFALHVPGQVVTLSYVQSGATISSFQPVTGGTVTGHGVQAKDTVFLGSTNSEFPTCWGYRCVSATVTTITVTDRYGYSPRSATASANDIGYLLKQERGRVGSVSIAMYNVNIKRSHQVNDTFANGPTVDIGSADASLFSFNRCYLEGYTAIGPTDDQLDRDRVWCAMLLNPGVGVSSAGVADSYFNRSNDGNIRYYAGQSDSYMRIDSWLQDSGAPTRVGPAVQIVEGNVFCKVMLNDITNADAFADQPAIQDLAGLGPSQLKIGGNTTSGNNNLVEGSCDGPAFMDPRLWKNGQNPSPSPWVRGWNGLWSGVTLTSPHIGPNRKDAIGSARDTNIWTPVANWEDATPFPAGVTVTQDALGPFGQTNAIKIVSTGSAQIVVGAYPHELPGSGTGGYVAFGCWVNSPDGTGLDSFTVNIGQYAGLRINGLAAMTAAPHIVGGAGWQWIKAFGKVTAAPDRHYAQLINMAAGEINLWGPTLVYLPPSIGDNDAYEWLNTFCAQPVYLPKGITGTFENDKFIAHGGIGMKSSLVTVTAPGTADRLLTIFDQDGNALIKLHGQAP